MIITDHEPRYHRQYVPYMASTSIHWANHANHQRSGHTGGKHTGVKASDLHEGDEGIDALALDRVLHRDHSSLGTGGVPHQGRLHLCRANAVPTHVDHIVHTPCSKQGNQLQQFRVSADLCCANAMPTYVDHIIHTPCSKQEESTSAT